MPKIVLRDFDGGMWLSTPPDKLRDGRLRRARGVSAIKTGSCRVRDGSEVLRTASNVHSYYYFRGAEYYGIAGTFYRNGVAIRTGLNGERLSFATMPPSVDKEDYLYVSGGGDLFKVAPDGTVSNWGIEAPTDGFTATLQDRSEKAIDALDATTGWTINGGSLAASSDIKQEGTNSLAATVAASTIATFWKSITTDLTTYGGGVPAPDEDHIVFWVLTTNPDAIEYMQIDFALSAWTVVDSVGQSNDKYTYRFEPGELDLRVQGAASAVDEEELKDDLKGREEDSLYPLTHGKTKVQVLKKGGRVKLAEGANVWTELRIPKALFEQEGDDTLTWADVVGVRFTIKTNDEGSIKAYIDDLKLAGGIGMQGEYRYRTGFYSEVTDTYSNPNPSDVITAVVDRQGVLLETLPTTLDAQVTHVVVWRTMGDGATFFLNTKLPIGTSSYLDEVADYYGLNSDNDAEYLQSQEMEIDNDPPKSAYYRCAGPFQGRMWWLCDCPQDIHNGKVYYSPAGRPEGVQGFVSVTSPDDPLVQMAIWGGRLYVLSEERLVEILGQTEPFIYREFEGVPGTSAPFTVAASPIGIIYEAIYGVVVFDGSSARYLYPDAVLPIFHGQDRSGFEAFTGITAAFWHNLYYISDGERTLAVHVESGEWYEYGSDWNTDQGFYTLFTEAIEDRLIGATQLYVLELEKESKRTDGSYAIPFMIETLAIPMGISQRGLLQRVYIDAELGAGQKLKPTLILDDLTEIALPLATNLKRGDPVEYSQLRKCRLVGLRIECDATGSLEIFEIGFDFHEGEMQ